MPLHRSESTRTTLSMMITRTGKYQKWLGMINVIILLSGLSMLFFGCVLKWHYSMDSLNFVTEYFPILVWLSIGLGSAAFIFAAFGLACSGMESKPPMIIYAILMVFMSLALFGKNLVIRKLLLELLRHISFKVFLFFAQFVCKFSIANDLNVVNLHFKLRDFRNIFTNRV